MRLPTVLRAGGMAEHVPPAQSGSYSGSSLTVPSTLRTQRGDQGIPETQNQNVDLKSEVKMHKMRYVYAAKAVGILRRRGPGRGSLGAQDMTRCVLVRPRVACVNSHLCPRLPTVLFRQCPRGGCASFSIPSLFTGWFRVLAFQRPANIVWVLGGHLPLLPGVTVQEGNGRIRSSRVPFLLGKPPASFPWLLCFAPTSGTQGFDGPHPAVYLVPLSSEFLN